MNAIKHIWWAIRYGQWDAGWDSNWGRKSDEPFLYFKPIYYDGHHCYMRIGKFWAGVSY